MVSYGDNKKLREQSKYFDDSLWRQILWGWSLLSKKVWLYRRSHLAQVHVGIDSTCLPTRLELKRLCTWAVAANLFCLWKIHQGHNKANRECWLRKKDHLNNRSWTSHVSYPPCAAVVSLGCEENPAIVANREGRARVIDVGTFLFFYWHQHMWQQTSLPYIFTNM